MTASAEGIATVGDTVTVRVRYPETDRMGVVYHAHYLVWFELGRTELLRGAGWTYATLEERDGLRLPVIEVRARYHAPARYDEVLAVRTRVAAIGRARIRFEYRVSRVGEVETLASGYTEHAVVGPAGRPRRLPPGLHECLRRLQEVAP